MNSAHRQDRGSNAVLNPATGAYGIQEGFAASVGILNSRFLVSGDDYFNKAKMIGGQRLVSELGWDDEVYFSAYR